MKKAILFSKKSIHQADLKPQSIPVQISTPNGSMALGSVLTHLQANAVNQKDKQETASRFPDGYLLIYSKPQSGEEEMRIQRIVQWLTIGICLFSVVLNTLIFFFNAFVTYFGPWEKGSPPSWVYLGVIYFVDCLGCFSSFRKHSFLLLLFSFLSFLLFFVSASMITNFISIINTINFLICWLLARILKSRLDPYWFSV